MKVTVIDYGLSNLLSVQHAFAHFGAEVQVTSSPADVLAADALVLPGVGAFQDGMQGLEQLGLIEPIKQKTAQGTLLMGICLGMQMLFDESEEFGLHKGLGLIPGRVVRIPDVDADGSPQRVPHISWNFLTTTASVLAQLPQVTLKLSGYAADGVEKLIDAIGTVTLDSEEAIKAARGAYDALTDAQKELVGNYQTLLDAEAKLAQLKKDAEKPSQPE